MNPYQLFEPLDKTTRDALKEDIAARGVLVPVEEDEHGNVLDGHHRKQIALELGKDYPRMIRVGMTEEEKRSHVRKLNLLRRHLNQEQKRTVIAEQLKDTAQLSDRQIAGMLGVSQPTVGVIRREMEDRGDVIKVITSTDTLGRQQPRERKPKTSYAANQKAAAKVQHTNGSAPSPVRVEERTPCPSLIPEEFRNAIVTGDARDLAKRLPDASVSLALADPVYKQTEDYGWLAHECERVLEPGGNLVVQCGTITRYECEVAMRKSGLEFVDLLAEIYPYALQALWKTRVQVGWKPWLWFSKGPWRSWGVKENEWIVNRIHAGGKRKADASKELHEWGDSEEFAAGLMGKLCGPSGIVWDPFTGSGTVPVAAVRLGIPFVAFEIDPAVAALTRERLNGTSRRPDAQKALDL